MWQYLAWLGLLIEKTYPLCGTLVSLEDFYFFYTAFGSLKGKGRVGLGWVGLKDISSVWFMWGKRKGCESNPHCA